MSKTDLQRSKQKLTDSLGRMAGTMGVLDTHMAETEKQVEGAAKAGHQFLSEIDQAAAQFIAELSGSNGPEEAVNQPEMTGGRVEADQPKK